MRAASPDSGGYSDDDDDDDEAGGRHDDSKRTNKKKSKGVRCVSPISSLSEQSLNFHHIGTQGRIASEITREELSDCFGMPSEEAAKKLGVGLTVLKRICRKFGVPRWPYRKLKSLDRLISNVEVRINTFRLTMPDGKSNSSTAPKSSVPYHADWISPW